MNFLIQSFGGVPVTDFCFELYWSIEYQNSNGGIHRDYILSENPKEEGIDSKGWCPVGSVEFVHDFMNHHGIKIPKPINIPEELRLNNKLNPKVLYLDGGTELDKTYFIKSMSCIKDKNNGPSSVIPYSGEWQLTDYLPDEIKSEWRCFVHNERLLDCIRYLGEWEYYPEESDVKGLISRYKNSPNVYTLDIVVFGDGSISTIEVHNFYSCGLYGFSRRMSLPQMFSQWYFNWLRKIEL